jgi:hypothetical protein
MKEHQLHAKGTCRSFSKILARSQAGASLELHSQNSMQVARVVPDLAMIGN